MPIRTDSEAIELPYTPPHDWDALLGFLERRAIAGVESVEQGAYRRTANLSHDGTQHHGWIEITPVAHRSAVTVCISTSLTPVIPEVLTRVEHLLDLACEPREIARVLGPLARAHPGLRLPGAFDGFELAVRAILGQQVTVAAARTLAGRFARQFGTAVDTPFDSLTTAFPAAQNLVRRRTETIAKLGIIRTRSESILAVAGALARGDLELRPGVDAEEMKHRLRELPGIGHWTAEYIAMRALAAADSFPDTDFGVMKALGTTLPRRARELGERWRPWRAYAVMHLWKSLE